MEIPAEQELIRTALAEDSAGRDVTTRATIPEDSRCRAVLRAKSEGVLSGIWPFRHAFELTGSEISGWSASPDGTHYAAGDTPARFEGRTRSVLSAERTALNLVQRLSGTATLTARFVDAVAGTGARICDTRKTTPLLRKLQKAAVLDGGGVNHRFDLSDGILIKDNHVAGAGGVAAAIEAVRTAAHHLLKIEVEVETLEQLEEALSAGPDAVLLDNMDLDTVREAVQRCKPAGIVVEASGDMTLERVREVAETGVDLISVGALTHSAPAANLSLSIEALD